MSGLTSKNIGMVALVTVIVGILALVSLLLFFVGLFQNIPSLSSRDARNDALNAVAGFLSAVHPPLYPALRTFLPRSRLLTLVGVWVGAIAITFGSWFTMTNRSGVELCAYYLFFGNGLIGVWLLTLNGIARQ